MMRKRWGIWCGGLAAVILLGVLAAVQFRVSPVASLRIYPDSVSLIPGVSVKLQVEGYIGNGRLATAEQCKALGLSWRDNAEDSIFTLSEDGVLTAISSGTGNVWVQSRDGKLNSRPITVFVK